MVWHFCDESNTTKELFVLFTMIINLIMIKLPSLKLRRLRSLAIEPFKIINHKSHVYLQSLLNIKSNQCYSFRYTNTVDVPQVRTTSNGLNSFRSGAARLWNSLPQHIREQSNENQLRSPVASWEGESCTCSFCSNVSWLPCCYIIYTYEHF